jgi:hypothetical protein
MGDVNGSNVPGTGAKSLLSLNFDYYDLYDYHDVISLSSGEDFELPIFATKELNVGAISLILRFPKEMVSIYNVQCTMNNETMNNEQCTMNNEGNNLVYNVVGDELRIGWYAPAETQCLASQDYPILIITGRATNNFKMGDVIRFSIANNPLCEFADEAGNPIENVVLKTYIIEYFDNKIMDKRIMDDRIMDKIRFSTNDLFIYPNPAENTVNIKYRLANDGVVNISIYDVLGEKVDEVVNRYVLKGVYNEEVNLTNILPGVYTCKMMVGGKNVVVKRVIVN